MGRGNSIIRREDGLQATSTYYIEYGEDENEEYELSQWSWEELIEGLQDFQLKGQVNKKHIYTDSFRNNYRVILETNVMQVIVSDNECNMAIACLPLGNIYDGSQKMSMAFKKQANYYMKMLNKCYSLRVRCSAWTSGKVETTKTNFY
jgi:hypothetical protein